MRFMTTVSKQNSIKPTAKAKASKTNLKVKPTNVLEDMSDLAPSDPVLMRLLSKRKVQQEWFEDGFAEAKPKKK
jgi:hypothetical protein